jgi:hypothetical protein
VWRLRGNSENNFIPSDLIYGDNALLRPTKIALQALRSESAAETISEAEMISTGVEKYYEALHSQRQTEIRDDPLVRAFNNGNGDALREASLIDDSYSTRDFLVLASESERERYRQYAELRDESRWSEAKRLFTELKPLVVTVPVTDGEDAETDQLSVIDLAEGQVDYSLIDGQGIHKDMIALAVER